MRNFDYSVDPGNAVHRKQRLMRKVFWRSFGFGSMVVLMLAAAVLYFYGANASSPEIATAASDAASIAAASRLPVDSMPTAVPANVRRIEVPEILEAHLKVLGGRKALQDVRSVRYEGKVYFAAGASDFQMLVLKPDKGMLVIDPGQPNSQKLMLNGDIAWRVIDRRDGTRQVNLLEKDSITTLQWSLRVHNTLRALALVSQFGGLVVQEINFDGKRCFELKKTRPNGSDFTAILDQETLYLLKMVETLKTPGGEYEFGVSFGDYRMVSGVLEPFSTILYRDGELDNEVELRSVQINPGVMSSLLSMPEELRP